MATRTTVDRARREISLRSTLEKYRGPTVDGLCERFAPLLEEGEDLGEAVDLLLRVLERCLDAREADLDRADFHHSRKNSRLGLLRLERREVAGELRRTLVDIRDTLKSFYGRKLSNRLLRIQGPTPKAHDTLNLLNQAGAALAGLRAIEQEPHRTGGPGVQVPFEEWRASWIETLEAGHARLAEIRRRIVAERHRKDETRLDMDQARKLHDRDLSAISNLQEALLILGIQPHLARSVWADQRPEGRPRRRKSASGSEETDEPSETRSRKEEATRDQAFRQVSSTEVG